MKNILEKIIKILIISLVILLPLVNSHFFDLIGVKIGAYVTGNYEFTKAILFNNLSGIIIILFFISNIKNKIIIPKITFILTGILFLSFIFSSFPITSLFGESGKGHGIILFLNLIGLYIVFINQKAKDLKKYLNYSIYSLVFVIFFGIKEYYFPTFDYGNLSNRAIGTFGHPNFLALYLLIFFPLIINNIKKGLSKKNNIFNYLIIFFIIFTILITQSIWGIFLLFFYIIYLEFLKHKEKINKKYAGILIILLIFILTYIIYNFGLITKLSSFISRFYIWKTTILILLSDFKNILFGLGADTMLYTFDTYKATELYIFENIGYTANRPHNLGLNLFYHFGILGLVSYICFIYKIYKLAIQKKSKKSNIFYIHSIILFLIFTIFNFSSIAAYLINILILSIIYQKNQKKKSILYFLPYILFSFLSIYGSYNYYSEEHKKFIQKGYISENKYYNKLILENPEKMIFKENLSLEKICQNLINKIPSAENYFYCGNLFWNYDKEKAINYYKLGLERIPNMWDVKSNYYNNILIKNLFVPERFYSEKFSNIKEILERIK
ncbi:MAG: O-antigen ligase family protein [Candidatus Gracilibacteria bacterium]